jgi:hypothetical protein
MMERGMDPDWILQYVGRRSCYAFYCMILDSMWTETVFRVRNSSRSNGPDLMIQDILLENFHVQEEFAAFGFNQSDLPAADSIRINKSLE